MEDSCEMSTAGQMETYLGVREFANLSKSIVKFWASQFAFVPIEYKLRGYGQPLNSPMAIVIQEMVNCECAGVIFTANPLDGDERLLTVTSNFGLGESVVSSAAEPDTFQLKVKIECNSYDSPRSVESILNKTLGRKSLIIRMNQSKIENGVFEELSTDGAERQSIDDEDVIRLGNIALLIQQNNGNARDIEWGLKAGYPILNAQFTYPFRVDFSI